jgi:octaprenyl-diphosphate synthase
MDSQYTSRTEKIEAVLGEWLPENPDSVWAHKVFSGLDKIPDAEMLRGLTFPSGDLLARGGKRWRPLLMTLVCETLGGGDAAIPLAPLVELCHNASLIHDDIEDNSDERRGKPAVHILYGIDTAINSGCFLYFLPLCCIDYWAAGLPGGGIELKNKVYTLWGEYMRRLHLGQAMDISWHRDFLSLPRIEDYLLMCSLKTGCLARLSAVMGVCAASAVNRKAAEHGEALAQLFGKAAENLGVGFQIIDDVKNLTMGLPGKKRGDDIVEGKKSLPVLMFLHRYPEQREFVSRCFAAARAGGAGVDEAEKLIQAIDSAGILGEAREQGQQLIEQAKDAVNGASRGYFQLNDEAGELLAGLFGQIG